jgi:osmoprotectant transport system substrate-binding protein/osmoprotectant transport system permease protein
VTDNLRQQLAQLPVLFGAHVLLTALALAFGIAASFPLSLLVARSPRVRWVALSSAGVIQTIPSLALLALMVPLLGAFGFFPALVALVLYSMLPILRNTVTGIAGVDGAVLEAALGMGMTPAQTLWRVELPLALPVIVAGIRTATVWIVGVATLSTPVGQPSLGNYIFSGLQTRNWAAVLVGCAAAALLALALDGLLAALEAGIARRRRSATVLSLSGLALIFGAGILAPRLASSGAPAAMASSSPTATHPSASSSTAANPADARRAPSVTAMPVVRVGSKTFTEQYILASLIEAQLTRAGLKVERTESLGSTVAFDALRNGDIDVYVEYTGTIWSNYMLRDTPESSWHTLALSSAWLLNTHGVRLLGALGFENAYALAMRRDRAAQLGIQSMADLARHAPQLALGSDYEFLERPEWRRLKQTYALDFARKVSFDPSFMYAAVAQGDVDVITAFSSDGRIASFDLVVLPDTGRAFPPYDAVLLLSPRSADSEPIVRALEPLLGSVSVERMRQANLMVDRSQDKRTPAEAARWLLEGSR